jgi:hypothetical protein
LGWGWNGCGKRLEHAELKHLKSAVPTEDYQGHGIKAMMDRLIERTGFRVHAHLFRYTFATVLAKLG